MKAVRGMERPSGLDKDYRWDLYVHSPNITVPKDTQQRLVREVVKQSTDGARGAQGFRCGHHIFEFRYNETPWGSHCSIGICGEKTRMRRKGYADVLGMDEQGWAWDIPSRELLHAGNIVGDFAKDEDTIPKVIRMTVNLDEGYISFDVGFGEHTCFRDVKSSGGLLFPAVAMVYGRTEVEILLLESSFSPGNGSHIVPLITEPGMRAPLPRDSLVVAKQNGVRGSDKSDEDDEQHNGDNDARDSSDKARTDQTPSTRCPDGTNDPGSNPTEGEDNVDSRGGLSPPNAVDPESRSTMTETTAMSTSSISDSETGDPSIMADDRLNPNEADAYRKQPSIVRRDTYTYEIADYPDEEKRAFIRVDTLLADDRHLLQVAHGWDPVSKGGRLALMPNSPSYCQPSLHAEGMVQGVRGRRAFKKGTHRWRLRQADLHGESPDGQPLANDLLIGIVDDEHRMYNFGYSLSHVGRHAWCWDPMLGDIWHDDQCVQTHVDPPVIDWQQGLEVLLDLDALTLTYILGTRNLRLQLMDARGSGFFPFVIVKSQQRVALEMEYVLGNEEHIAEVLESTRSMTSRDWQEFIGFRALLRSGNSMGAIVNENSRPVFGWGMVSSDVEINQQSRNEATVAVSNDVVVNHALLFAEHALSTGKHSLDFTFTDVERLVIGLVSDGVSQGDACTTQCEQREAAVMTQLTQCWAWDVSRQQIYCSGYCVGSYPAIPFDLQNVRGLRMHVIFNHEGEATASFSALTDDGRTAELGVAFIQLPLTLLPAVNVGSKFSEAKLALLYHSGPASFIQAISHNSKVCIIQ